MRCVLGIDAGQTSTKAALCTLDGRITTRLEAGPWDTTGNERGRARCKAALESVREQIVHGQLVREHIERQLSRLEAVCIGMTGGLSGADLVTGWAKRLFGCANVIVLPDMEVNLRGANPESGAGIVAVAGGGSVVWGKTAGGKTALAGGYGYLLNDEGSAYEIGRQALVAALRASQQVTAPTALQPAIEAFYGTKRIWDVRRMLYSAPDPRALLSDLAPLVARVAEEGDVVASEIVQHAADSLADMVLAVARRLDMAEHRVFPTGGVLEAKALIRRRFEKAARRATSTIKLCEPAMPPLGGALLIALEAATDVTPDTLLRLISQF